MDKIKNKEAFRSAVVLKLIDTHDLTVDEVITSAKKIEDYVFQEQLTFHVANINDRKMLDAIAKGFLEQRDRAAKIQAVEL